MFRLRRPLPATSDNRRIERLLLNQSRPRHHDDCKAPRDRSDDPPEHHDVAPGEVHHLGGSADQDEPKRDRRAASSTADGLPPTDRMALFITGWEDRLPFWRSSISI